MSLDQNSPIAFEARSFDGSTSPHFRRLELCIKQHLRVQEEPEGRGGGNPTKKKLVDSNGAAETYNRRATTNADGGHPRKSKIAL